jgi:hypothetical protein
VVVEVQREVADMTRPLWAAVGLMLFGAAMVLADVGVPGLWVAVTLVGMALFVVLAERVRPSNGR